MSKVVLRRGKQVYKEIEEPAMVITKTGEILYLGEAGEAGKFLENSKDKFNIGYGFLRMSQSLFYVELPKNQEEVDRLFNYTGYARKYIPTDKVLVG